VDFGSAMDRHDDAARTIARESPMANDKLGNRKILGCAFDFTAPRRGPTEVYALNSALPVLANAIIEAADLFEFEGRIVMLVGEELHVVTPAILAGAIPSNLVRKSLRNVGTVEAPKWERAFAPVEVGEAALRMLLQNEKYGLPGRLSLLEAADVVSREPQVEEAAVAPSNSIEHEAGQRALAKHAGAAGERTRQEIEKGQRRAAQFQT
jgi:hypothetical protein